MSIIDLGMLGIGAVIILSGFLYGFKRGFKKALLRLVILGVCVALSFLYREKISDIALNTPISEGKSLLELLTESFSSGENAEQMEGLLNVITNILKMVIQIFVFIICFYVLKTVSMILYWIFSGIITSREKRKVRNSHQVEGNKIDETKVKYEVKKNRKKWFGSLVGIGQGILIIIFVVGPLNGLVVNISSLIKSLSEVEMEGTKIIDENTVGVLDNVGLFDYGNSSVSKVYTLLGDGVYKEVSKIEDENGNTVNIKSQIEAIDGGVKMVDVMSGLSNLDTSEGFTADTKDELVNIFNELDEIKENMSEEGVEQLDNLIKDVVSPMLGEAAEDLPINLDEISFAEVDFSNEAEVIDSFYGLMEKAENGEELDTDEVLEEVITNLSDSNLILPILSQVVEGLPEEEQLNLSEEDKNKVEEIINRLDNKENADELKALFGIE